MNPREVYREILQLWIEGLDATEIARQTAAPHKIITYCIAKFETEPPREMSRLEIILKRPMSEKYIPIYEAYAYLFGLYLGDGNIVKARRVYRLRVTLDAKYPNIIEECVKAEQTLFPENQIGIVESFYKDRLSYVNVSLYHRDLPHFFPQHGVGDKHSRKIELKAWQQKIVDAYPLEFFRGLYHSDGSRSSNHRQRQRLPALRILQHLDSTSLKFSAPPVTESASIGRAKIFQVPNHHVRYDVMIAKRKDVAYLDSVIGPKT